MEFTAKDVMALRERSGAGMMDCKKALKECDGDIEKALDYLREKSLAASAKKASRIAAEGIVDCFVCEKCGVGVIIEVNCETDFVAKTDAFKEFAQNIAMHIAAENPKYVTRDEVPQAELDHEREVLIAQAKNEGKPDNIVEKMVEGRLKKFYGEVCLMDQVYIRAENNETIETYVKEGIAQFGENIKVRRFARFEMGEGLEKRVDDFAAEVAAQAGM